LGYFDFEKLITSEHSDHLYEPHYDNGIIWKDKNNINAIFSGISSNFKQRFQNALETAKILESGNHPDKLTIPYIVNWASTKNVKFQLLEWLAYYNEKSRLESIETNIPQSGSIETSSMGKQAQRELVLKGWLVGNGVPIEGKIDKFTRAEVWQELQKADKFLISADART
jgi:hypothetical protein